MIVKVKIHNHGHRNLTQAGTRPTFYPPTFFFVFGASVLWAEPTGHSFHTSHALKIFSLHELSSLGQFSFRKAAVCPRRELFARLNQARRRRQFNRDLESHVKANFYRLFPFSNFKSHLEHSCVGADAAVGFIQVYNIIKFRLHLKSPEYT
jgi:hypothetical protein